MKPSVRQTAVLLGVLLSLGATAPAEAQEAPDFSGHWVGAIVTPGGDLGIDVDLARADDGSWTGDISIPVQATQDFPLSDVTVEGSILSFRLAGVPGDPTFKGTLSDDGKTITGPFTQGGAELQFNLARQTP